MDDRRFDALTRAMAQGSSRRTAIKGLFGGLLGGVALATRLDRAGAQAECTNDDDCDIGRCCNGLCVLGEECCLDIECGACGFCGEGSCVNLCAQGEKCCSDGTCVPINGCCDPSECPNLCSTCARGICFTPQCCGNSDCGACEICDEGTCQDTCSGNLICCTSGDESHCAECCNDDQCPTCQYCSDGGTCGTRQCCDDDDCGNCESCVSGVCEESCLDGQKCCGELCIIDTLCCVDQDCATGLRCCEGACIGPDTCCVDSECDPCEICFNGACSYLCGTDQQCCESLGLCVAIGACCSSNDCDCGQCVEGECTYTCTDQQECCDDVCYPIGTCCSGADETCGGGLFCCPDYVCCNDVCVPEGECSQCIPQSQTCAGSQFECCPDLMCCEFDGGSACQECCGDDDCGRCRMCDSGVCVNEPDCCIGSGGICHLDDVEMPTCCDNLLCCAAGNYDYCAECCSDNDCGSCEVCDSGVCAPKTDCCRDEGETCGTITLTAADGAEQYDCCDGFVCCFGQFENICAECCSDSDCDAGGTCEDWVCVYPGECHHDHDCPKGTCCCDDGDCSRKCCPHPHPHPHPKPPKPAPDSGGSVTTLPATGSGPEAEGAGLFGAVALGVAALLAAKKLRDDQAISEAPVEE